ncbi:MAG: 2-oxoacid:acceptor oxidoreductase subunit alpha [Actinomycetota bacterium]|nr:2-oxoacid:acceptor oxidoreductase subunit alpha [Actinomycetota bacterium]
MTINTPRQLQELEKVVIRFAGDSGDGMQLAGDRFSVSSALFGNDLATVPDYPAEIRAPAGTLAGVSAFQIHISDHDILTPGDAPNVLVAMNPAALRVNLADLEAGSTVIVNADAFVERALTKAGYGSNPLTDGSLSGFTVYEVPMTSLTLEATKPSGAKSREAERAKNFFALGLLSWMYSRPIDPTLRWIEQRFSKMQAVAEANTLAFKAGYNFGETAELVGGPFAVKATTFRPGTYTSVSGNTALAWGIVAAGQLANLPVFLASYPITPASDILHELSRHQNFGVRTMQAEDEIAAAGAALGASYGGHLGVTTTSGPGMDLKAETLGLAISLELPLLVIDVQRGGPSTGLPTKTEQSDLLMAMHGRQGEAPLPIGAPRTPGDCFYAAIEATRIALKYRTPVILLSDGYLANSAEPWRVPPVQDLPDVSVPYASEPNHTTADGTPEFLPYVRDVVTLARPWAIPGTPGLEHRIGGLEKADRTGAVSYDAANHELMVRTRAAKVAGIADDIPLVDLDDPDGEAEVLVLGWGSTYGSIVAAVERIRRRGLRVAHAHLTHLNPFPPNLGDVVRRYRRVLVPEMNLGQLTSMIRAEFLVDARVISKVQGQRFLFSEIEAAVLVLMEEPVAP